MEYSQQSMHSSYLFNSNNDLAFNKRNSNFLASYLRYLSQVESEKADVQAQIAEKQQTIRDNEEI